MVGGGQQNLRSSEGKAGEQGGGDRLHQDAWQEEEAQCQIPTGELVLHTSLTVFPQEELFLPAPNPKPRHPKTAPT